MKPSYSEHDYTFGQAMLTLRTQIGLTQAELARHLGVSRRAVGGWEAGSSYPKVEHLKALIALAVENRAFPVGKEAREIRMLWKAAHQKVLLDERWLSVLLDQQCCPPPEVVPLPAEETRTGAPVISDSTPQPGPDHEHQGWQSISLQPLTPSQPQRLQLPLAKCSRWIFVTLAGIMLLLLVHGGIVAFPAILHKLSPDLFPALCGGKFQSSTHSNIAPLPATGTSSDGEPIGLSLGANIFDLQRTNPQGVQYKVQAARDMANDPQMVVPSLRNALSSDPADAEARIYLENWAVLGSNHPHITIVVGVNFAATIAAGSRGTLQGAFTAQKKCNDQNRQDPRKTLIVLMIANISGNNPDDRARSAMFVADQIADQTSQDPTIVAIMGWPSSTDSINVNHRLKIRESLLPMVSSSSASDELGDRYNFFRVSPTNSEQAEMAANFMLNKQQKRSIAILYDSTTSFGANLEDDFATDVANNIVGSESYRGGDTNTLRDALTKVLAKKPDAIFFAGYVGDLDGLLRTISSTPYANLLIVGGDTLANTTAYPNPLPNLHNVYFTSFASANEWDGMDPKPPFFQDYEANFGTLIAPNGLPSIDNNVMLGYDALLVLLRSAQHLLSTQNTLTPSDLTQILHQIRGRNAIQGVTGRIAFKLNGDQQNKRVNLEHIEGTSLRLDDCQGCFLLTDACARK